MNDQHTPQYFAIRSIKFTAYTALLGLIVIVFVWAVGRNVGLGGGIALMPFVLFTFFAMLIGGVIGIMSGRKALGLVKLMPTSEEKSTYKYFSLFGIFLGVIELAVFFLFFFGSFINVRNIF